jgi:Mn-dependent DtxR family transcriptional regulator
MLDEIMKEVENSKGPLTVKELARRLDVEESALEGMLEFLERKGKLSVYRPEDRCEECGLISCTSCVFKSACPNSEEGGDS